MWFGLRQEAQSFVENIDGRVVVPVVDDAAFRTLPLPNLQVLGAGPLCATGRTKLTGWIEAIHDNYTLSVPVGLVFQLAPEFAPTDIGNGTCQLMISHHILRSKIFDADYIVLANDFRGQLMLHIPALIGHVLMKSSHLKPGFLPVAAALCFSGQLTLEFGQFLQTFSQILVIGIFNTI